MSTFRIRNTVLPAFLMSSVVFSALTLPFIWLKSEPLIVELQPIFRGEIQPVFESENRNMIVRYIGGSLVISVGAGLTTVELLRRQNRLRQAQIEEESAGLERSATQEATIASTLDEPEIGNRFLHPEAAELQPVAIDGWLDEAPVQEAPANQCENQLEGLHCLIFPRAETQSLSTDICSTPTILNSEAEYQTCRVKVPHLERRLFAVQVGAKYYSFFKTHKTQAEAVEVANKLSQRNHQVVITHTAEQGYVIWVWEPEANLELVS